MLLLVKKVYEADISMPTSIFLSGDRTECWYSVMAVSGGHMGLLHTDLNVICLTCPSYSSAACHCPIWKQYNGYMFFWVCLLVFFLNVVQS